MSSKIYIGVDMAKVNFAAATWFDQTGTALNTFSNTPDGFAQLAEQMQTLWPSADTQFVLVMEPTGGYELGLVAYAFAHQWQVCLPNPKQVRDFAKSCGRRAKTDVIDALVLAQFGAEQHPEPQAELPAEIRELDELLRRREDLQKLKSSEHTRLLIFQQRPQPTATVIQSLERTLAALEAELAAIERAIEDLLKRHPHHYLYMGALGGIRGNNPLRHFYRRLVARGKAKRLALVASAHKILVWAWAVFSKDADFDPSRFPAEASAAA